MRPTPPEMLQGTVDILVLRALAWDSMHGYAISRWLAARSDGVLTVDAPGKDRQVILSHGFWERALGSDPAVVGTRMTLSGRTYDVVGVMPRGCTYGRLSVTGQSSGKSIRHE